jgi:diphosphomevalonate decarboxylase
VPYIVLKKFLMPISNSIYKVNWRSPSNIAIIKYWGKHGRQLPVNPSISMTLKKCFTDLEFSVFEKATSNGDINVHFFFNGQRNDRFEQRIEQYFNSIKDELPFLSKFRFEIQSENSFPHSSGIASSASSMSALALSLVSFSDSLGLKIDEPSTQFASYLARLASGSACRSVFGGWTIWGELPQVTGSSDEHAINLPFEIHPNFQSLQDVVLITSSTPKKVSSSEGHYKMTSHPYNEARKMQAGVHAVELLEALKIGDFASFASIAESEALSLHALMLSSEPGYFLINSGTLQIIEEIRSFREDTGVQLCFTLDAGPNVHLLYPLKEKNEVMQFIKEELLMLCEGGRWLDDGAGDGPIMIIE